MARFLLDSNFCIACLRRKPWALHALGSVPMASVAVSSITVGELWLGTKLAQHATRELTKVEAFLRPLQVIPFGSEEAYVWAGVEAQLRKDGNRIEAEDAMIAATAMASGMVLVSGNARHMTRVKGLKSVDWEQRPPKGTPQP